jgi:hypothetical protein
MREYINRSFLSTVLNRKGHFGFLMLPNTWPSNISILRVRDEGLFQIRVVGTKFDIYGFFLLLL